MASKPQPSIASKLLSRAHSPETASTLFHDRVQHRPVLLRPTSPDAAADARSKRQHARRKKAAAKSRRTPSKPVPLSAKQKRALGLNEIPPSQRKYAIYEPLHRMWSAYMREVLGLGADGRSFVTAQGSGQVLLTADYHGALVQVVRSRCIGRVGLCGIVVRDTKFTFDIVTREDEVKTLPKEHTVFRFEVETEDRAEEKTNEQASAAPALAPLVFELHGGQFEGRPPDRANRKFKWHARPDL